jgi:predicted nucleotidyltransferase
MTDSSKGRRQSKQKTHHYKVLAESAVNGFELAEHKLSKQLLFVFRSLPPLELAEELEVMGFAHMHDELTFTMDVSPDARKNAMALAARFAKPSRSR